MTSDTNVTKHFPALLVMEERRRTAVYPASVLDRLSTIVDWTGPAVTSDQLSAEPELLRGVHLLFTGWGGPHLDDALLQSAPALRAVFVASGTVRAVVSEAFWARRIPIVSAAAANAIPVAEFSLAQILLGLKQSYRVAARLRESRGGQITAGTSASGSAKAGVIGAYGTRVGLLSLGAIGVRVARLLRAFDVEVCAHDPFATPQLARSLGVALVPLDELFSTCTVVSVHTPLLPGTRGLIDGRLVSLLPPGATLLNTARGAVINESELIAVLRRRLDVTAVLDVTWPEPPSAESPLYSLPNVVLTGHLAGAHGSECARLGELVADELERFARNTPLLHEVDAVSSALRA